MNIEKISSNGLVTKYKLVIPAKELSDKVTQQLKKIGQGVKIQGFRPGKVPETILRQRYLEKALEDSANQLVHKAMQDINKEVGRHAVDPTFDVETFEDGKDFICNITIESFPTVELGDLSGIEIERLTVTIPESEVDLRLQDILKNHKKKVVPETERPVKEGDLVSVTLKATVGGKPYKGLRPQTSITAEKKPEGPFPKLVESLFNKKIGESYEVKDTLPDDGAPHAGEDVTIKVKIDKIEELHSYKADDELAKEFGSQTFKEFMESLAGRIQTEYDNLSRLYSKRLLLDQLDTRYTYDLPPSMVTAEFDAIWSQFKREYDLAKKEGSLDAEDLDKSEDDFKKDYKVIAERRVRLGILMSEVSAKHKIALDKDEIGMAVFQEAMRYPGQFNEVLEFYKKNQNALQNLVAPVLEDKVVDFILEQVKRTEKAVDVLGLKSIVKGVIPTPFDDEEDEAAPAKAKASKSKSKG